MTSPRKKAILAAGAAAVAFAASGGLYLAAGVRAQPTPACNPGPPGFRPSGVCPPAGWGGRVFKLAAAYPAAAPPDAAPWKAFDPVTQPDEYVRAILDHFYEGNLRSDEASFDPALNATRQWYNAPWQDFGTNGREPIHGLTRERVSRPFELHAKQTSSWNNYAVGFYNAPGAVAIGRMWANRAMPAPAQASNLPEGTVAAKLLFTTATVAEVPYLAGAPEWDAYVFADPNEPRPKATSPRAVMKVRLLQIDVAVKDSRLASKTGWAFGTFVYGGGPDGAAGSGWRNVSPVGLMWGNDPGYTGTGPLKETWINPAVKMPHVGYQGRLNGPVDNEISSCLSCHSTAETPAGVMTPGAGDKPDAWFRNIPSGTPFDAGRTPLDYSLQVSVGLSNFQTSRQIVNTKAGPARQLLLKRIEALDTTPPRDGGPVH